MNNIIDLAQEIFGINVKIGVPHSIEDLNESMNTPKYATAIGLINYAIEEKKLEALLKKFFIKTMKIFLLNLILI